MTTNAIITKGESKIGKEGYFVYEMGGRFWAIYSFGNGETMNMGHKSYKTAAGADRALNAYRKAANE